MEAADCGIRIHVVDVPLSLALFAVSIAVAIEELGRANGNRAAGGAWMALTLARMAILPALATASIVACACSPRGRWALARPSAAAEELLPDRLDNARLELVERVADQSRRQIRYSFCTFSLYK